VAALAACGDRPVPNVVLLVVDTLRADHSSAYGYERNTTPRLRALAEEGIRFEQAYAPVGLTAPSHASLFTSLHPLSHGVVRNGLTLGKEHVTLAEYLGVRGYQSAAVVSSFVLDGKFGLDQGFDFYDDELVPAEATVELLEWEGHPVAEGFDRRADHTTRRAIEWLTKQRDPERPFFLFVHYFDPHSPYEPPDSHAGHFGPEGDGLDEQVAAYDAEIAFTDTAIGELLDSLDEQGLADNTLLIVTADHGEGLMQRGYMLHGITVHEEELRVPLIVRWPAELSGGRSVPEPVSLQDVAPSVADLVPISRMGGVREGNSFASVLRGGEPLDAERRLYLFRRDFGDAHAELATLGGKGLEGPAISVAGPQYGLREGRWKYVIAPREAPPALFDLTRDPGERENVAAREPEATARLASHLSAWLDGRAALPAAADVPSEADRARLRALGYSD
jgi:arylsulfatase A-like enzyme